MNRLPRDEKARQGIMRDLHYEINMFRFTGFLLHSGVAEDSPLSHALLESFLVHARNLIPFFFEVGAEKDDVVATEFFTSPDLWRKARGRMEEVLRDLPPRAGKQLAHLTWARLNVPEEEKKWKVTEIALAMEQVISAFEKEISAAQFPRESTQLLQMLPALTEQNTAHKTVIGTTSTAMPVNVTEFLSSLKNG